MARNIDEVVGVERIGLQWLVRGGEDTGVERMCVGDDVNVRPCAQNFGMDGPFGMPPAAASDLAAVPVDQYEIVGSRHLAEPDAVALHPEAASAALAHRQVAERH